MGRYPASCGSLILTKSFSLAGVYSFRENSNATILLGSCRRQSRRSRQPAWPNKPAPTRCSRRRGSAEKAAGTTSMPTPTDAVCTSRAGEPPRRPTVQTRLSIYNLDTLELVGEIAGVGGNGAAVDPKSGHGFTSSKPVSMFDTKTMTLIKTIDAGAPHGRTASTSMRSTKGSTSSVTRRRTRR